MSPARAAAVAAAAVLSVASAARAADDDCFSRPEVQQYLQYIQKRMVSHWLPPGDAPVDAQVKLRFAVDARGSVTLAEVAEGNDALGKTAVEALRAAAPFDPMSERARCMAGQSLIGAFTLPPATSR